MKKSFQIFLKNWSHNNALLNKQLATVLLTIINELDIDIVGDIIKNAATLSISLVKPPFEFQEQVSMRYNITKNYIVNIEKSLEKTEHTELSTKTASINFLNGHHILNGKYPNDSFESWFKDFYLKPLLDKILIASPYLRTKVKGFYSASSYFTLTDTFKGLNKLYLYYNERIFSQYRFGKLKPMLEDCMLYYTQQHPDAEIYQILYDIYRYQIRTQKRHWYKLEFTSSHRFNQIKKLQKACYQHLEGKSSRLHLLKEMTKLCASIKSKDSALKKTCLKQLSALQHKNRNTLMNLFTDTEALPLMYISELLQSNLESMTDLQIFFGEDSGGISLEEYLMQINNHITQRDPSQMALGYYCQLIMRHLFRVKHDQSPLNKTLHPLCLTILKNCTNIIVNKDALQAPALVPTEPQTIEKRSYKSLDKAPICTASEDEIAPSAIVEEVNHPLPDIIHETASDATTANTKAKRKDNEPCIEISQQHKIPNHSDEYDSNLNPSPKGLTMSPQQSILLKEEDNSPQADNRPSGFLDSLRLVIGSLIPTGTFSADQEPPREKDTTYMPTCADDDNDPSADSATLNPKSNLETVNKSIQQKTTMLSQKQESSASSPVGRARLCEQNQTMTPVARIKHEMYNFLQLDLKDNRAQHKMYQHIAQQLQTLLLRPHKDINDGVIDDLWTQFREVISHGIHAEVFDPKTIQSIMKITRLFPERCLYQKSTLAHLESPDVVKRYQHSMNLIDTSILCINEQLDTEMINLMLFHDILKINPNVLAHFCPDKKLEHIIQHLQKIIKNKMITKGHPILSSILSDILDSLTEKNCNISIALNARTKSKNSTMTLNDIKFCLAQSSKELQQKALLFWIKTVLAMSQDDSSKHKHHEYLYTLEDLFEKIDFSTLELKISLNEQQINQLETLASYLSKREQSKHHTAYAILRILQSASAYDNHTQPMPEEPNRIKPRSAYDNHTQPMPNEPNRIKPGSAYNNHAQPIPEEPDRIKSKRKIITGISQFINAFDNVVKDPLQYHTQFESFKNHCSSPNFQVEYSEEIDSLCSSAKTHLDTFLQAYKHKLFDLSRFNSASLKAACRVLFLLKDYDAFMEDVERRYQLKSLCSSALRELILGANTRHLTTDASSKLIMQCHLIYCFAQNSLHNQFSERLNALGYEQIFNRLQHPSINSDLVFAEHMQSRTLVTMEQNDLLKHCQSLPANELLYREAWLLCDYLIQDVLTLTDTIVKDSKLSQTQATLQKLKYDLLALNKAPKQYQAKSLAKITYQLSASSQKRAELYEVWRCALSCIQSLGELRVKFNKKNMTVKDMSEYLSLIENEYHQIGANMTKHCYNAESQKLSTRYRAARFNTSLYHQSPSKAPTSLQQLREALEDKAELSTHDLLYLEVALAHLNIKDIQEAPQLRDQVIEVMEGDKSSDRQAKEKFRARLKQSPCFRSLCRLKLIASNVPPGISSTKTPQQPCREQADKRLQL